MTDRFDLTGRVAIVGGGSRGLGRAMVQAFAEHGADVVHQRFGRCDVLVNNAGMSPLYGSLSEASEEHFDKVVGVNFEGPFRLSALVGERMAAGDGGSLMDAFTQTAKRTIPLRRGGEPDEVVGAALYLASDASSYTTGSVIKIDGGAAFAPA